MFQGLLRLFTLIRLLLTARRIAQLGDVAEALDRAVRRIDELEGALRKRCAELEEEVRSRGAQ